MSYQTAIPIIKAIKEIKKRNYVLPSIQREFVWDTEQIERLFDSLMRDYPIGTFLFWKVDKSKVSDFQFYEFLSKYHEKTNRRNTKIDIPVEEDVIAILDGQQRLTSLLIGLAGSFAQKIPYKRKNNPDAYPKKKLYLNLLGKSNDIELEYDFRFLKEDEVKHNKDNYWFEVAEILKLDQPGKINLHTVKLGLMDTSKYSQEQIEFVINTLSKLQNIIHEKGIISFYLEESNELDKVLQIFIRINSGGTKLSYSDLLLSIATAKWEEKDAREVIHEFVDEINRIGHGFDFNKDLVLKSCLVLSDFSDIKFKVDNFTRRNMATVEENWDGIALALSTAIQLIAKFGYTKDTLSTTNALIPIAYFIYKNKNHNSILHSGTLARQRANIKEWLARVILKGTFGGTPDGIYPIMRNIINQHPGEFPLEAIIDHYKGRRKSIVFDEDDIDQILNLQYGKSKTFAALSLIYESINHSFNYDQDHIHPQKFFRRSKLLKLGIPVEQMEAYFERYNRLPNLQLLESTDNKEKSGRQFHEWLNQKYPARVDKDSFLRQHFISSDLSLEFEAFLTFYERRKQKLKQKLVSILNVPLKNNK